MPKFIYSIKEIFDTETGCLKHNNVDGYFIGPYQRGYKWKSQSANDHIPVLLVDLYEAFLKSQENGYKDHEYYLQYITVKRIKHHDKFLFELIDGQQRLTSLTIMYMVLEKFFQDNHAKKNNEFLVSYSRYEGNENIFNEIISLLETDKNEDENLKEQDKYYMLKAARCFKTFFGLFDDTPDELNKFVIFINNNVKLILNKEDETTSSEEIFSNLNANKVPLTNSYLIKGLLLTKASRNGTSEISKKHFREILDERAIMGRTWDEMNSWFEKKQVRRFFFGNVSDGMEQMLKLIKFKTDKNKSAIINNFKSPIQDKNTLTGTYELFNYFHDNLLTSTDASNCLNKVKHIYKRLKSWYEDNLTFNFLGYYLETSKNKFEKTSSLIELGTNKEVISTIQNHLCKLLDYSKSELEDLKYGKGKGNDKISYILLALSVFPESEQKYERSNYRFNFYEYQKEEWSLEHIFPQNPKLSNFIVGDDKEWVIKRLKNRVNYSTNYQDIITAIETDQEISTDNISFIFDEIDEQNLNNLGNMALLSGKVNTALSNGFFNTKRKILIRKVNSGSFVPKHTLDVFSKMLETEDKNGFEESLITWSANDISAHRNWIIGRVDKIVSQLKAEKTTQEVIA